MATRYYWLAMVHRTEPQIPQPKPRVTRYRCMNKLQHTERHYPQVSSIESSTDNGLRPLSGWSRPIWPSDRTCARQSHSSPAALAANEQERSTASSCRS